MMSYNSSKLGQTDLIFDLWSVFTRRSVHTGWTLSTCTSYDLFYPG